MQRIRLVLRVMYASALAGLAAGPLLGQGTSPDASATSPPTAGIPSPAPDTQGAALTLDEAQRLAHRNNPVFLQSVATRHAADGAVRAAYGGLLPQALATLSGGYQQAGQVFFSGSPLGVSADALQSQWALGLTYQLSASTLLTPAFERANRDAAAADVTGAGATLEAQVASEYVTAVEDDAHAALQDSLVTDARLQLELARARVAVGSATALDQRRAEVALGQQQVSALQAHTAADIDKLRLYQLLGVPQPAAVQLRDDFPVAMPAFSLDSVLALAHRDNPQVNSTRAHAHAADVGVRRAHGLYAPTLSVSTGIGGYTYQYTNDNFLVNGAQATLASQLATCLSLDTVAQAAGLPPRACGPGALTPAQIAAIRAGNRQFPFGFTNTPRQLIATFSLPVFDGFQRERTVEQAEVDRDNAHYTERARELQLKADVASAYLSLETSVHTVQIQAQNAAAARDALSLAEERYRVGAATFVDVNDARAAYERAENDHISAVYDYHKAFTALESAVGRPLR